MCNWRRRDDGVINVDGRNATAAKLINEVTLLLVSSKGVEAGMQAFIAGAASRWAGVEGVN